MSLSKLNIENLQIELSDKKIISNLSYHFKDQSLSVILGRSGCGKSTFMRAIAGLTPFKGKINNSYQSQSIVFQESRLIPWLTVSENVLVFANLKKQTVSQSQISTLLEKVGLFSAAHLYPQQLSGGMKMRAALARALITQPELLLLDEPFSALDEPTRIQLGQLLIQLKQDYQMTILMISHQIEESLQLANEVILMGQGLIKKTYDLSKMSQQQGFYENSELMKIAQNIRQEYIGDLHDPL